MAEPINPEEQARRVERFRALLDQHFAGVKIEMGRALGWRDGAYVRQIVEGERPVSEKLIAKIETMNGGRYRGWFTPPGATPLAAVREPWPLDPFVPRDVWLSLTPEQRGAVAWEAAKVLERMAGAGGFALPGGSSRKRADAA